MSISRWVVNLWHRISRPKQYWWLLPFPLFALTGWRIAEPVFKFTGHCRSYVPAQEQVCRFDSFSEPSIAAAVLRQEADRLLGAYLQEDPQNLNFGPGSPNPTDPARPALGQCPIERSPSIPAIQNLQKEVHALDSDLDRALMVIYFRERSWNNFLDCYLHFLQTDPQSAFVLILTRSALIGSENCGRTDEVLDALAHFTKLHGELKSTQLVRGMLEQWKAAHPAPSDDCGSFKEGGQ
jgi:hypothetical protein